MLPQIVLSVLKSRRVESKSPPEVSKSQLKRQRCSRKNSDELTPVNSVVRIITLIRTLEQYVLSQFFVSFGRQFISYSCYGSAALT